MSTTAAPTRCNAGVSTVSRRPLYLHRVVGRTPLGETRTTRRSADDPEAHPPRVGSLVRLTGIPHLHAILPQRCSTTIVLVSRERLAARTAVDTDHPVAFRVVPAPNVTPCIAHALVEVEAQTLASEVGFHVSADPRTVRSGSAAFRNVRVRMTMQPDEIEPPCVERRQSRKSGRRGITPAPDTATTVAIRRKEAIRLPLHGWRFLHARTGPMALSSSCALHDSTSQRVAMPPGSSFAPVPSTHRLHEPVDGPIADPASVFNPLFDRLPEVEPDEDARASVLAGSLVEARVPTEHR